MIPKKIHYAWFGGAKPKYLIDNIKSWEKFLPDYEIIEWNNENWDISKYLFSKYYYDKKKYGFVIDPLRVDVLRRYGGIYIDADVTITQNLDRFLNASLFLGMHFTNAIGTALVGSEKNSPVMIDLDNFYKDITVEDLMDESFDKVSNGIFTRYMVQKYPDFKMVNRTQKLNDGLMIYPKQYFVLPALVHKHNFAIHANEGSWNSLNTMDTKINDGMIKNIGRAILGPTLVSWRSNQKQMKQNSLYQLYLERGKK